jgi:hypothetical protein
MKRSVRILPLALLCLTGCVQVPPLPATPSTTMSSWSPMGGFTMSSGVNCAGHATLDSGGASTISDACFSSVTDVVLCTDTTYASAVRCLPGAGTLSVSGAAGDTIAYARVR